MSGSTPDARRLLGALEREATAPRHARRAHRGAGVYRACGYTDIPAYDDNVYASHRFERRLPGPDGG
ncbi:hypothetical protein [Streptomyces sp. NPDC056628]|uniref:hypothetical protein n=1 Tax=Streptomyces sp. NPDC056628 TaxID=3345882 RepID=UPI003689DC94